MIVSLLDKTREKHTTKGTFSVPVSTNSTTSHTNPNLFKTIGKEDRILITRGFFFQLLLELALGGTSKLPRRNPLQSEEYDLASIVLPKFGIRMLHS
jgi:hypothetical protein